MLRASDNIKKRHSTTLSRTRFQHLTQFQLYNPAGNPRARRGIRANNGSSEESRNVYTETSQRRALLSARDRIVPSQCVRKLVAASTMTGLLTVPSRAFSIQQTRGRQSGQVWSRWSRVPRRGRSGLPRMRGTSGGRLAGKIKTGLSVNLVWQRFSRFGRRAHGARGVPGPQSKAWQWAGLPGA